MDESERFEQVCKPALERIEGMVADMPQDDLHGQRQARAHDADRAARRGHPRGIKRVDPPHDGVGVRRVERRDGRGLKAARGPVRVTPSTAPLPRWHDVGSRWRTATLPPVRRKLFGLFPLPGYYYRPQEVWMDDPIFTLQVASTPGTSNQTAITLLQTAGSLPLVVQLLPGT
jgi:hypothetical protein